MKLIFSPVEYTINVKMLVSWFRDPEAMQLGDVTSATFKSDNSDWKL